jgi:hypothetical protein
VIRIAAPAILTFRIPEVREAHERKPAAWVLINRGAGP